MTGIYKVTNNINGLFYIGAAKDIQKRWSMHRAPSKIKNGKCKIDAAYREFGIENFTFEVVEECPIENLYEREKYWISTLNPQYNQCSGGKGVSGRVYTEEQLRKASELSKKAWLRKTKEEQEYIITHNLTGPKEGHVVSQETREKLRNANIGKKQSEETRSKRSIKMKSSMLGNTNGNKPVVALTANGEFAGWYASSKIAADFLGINPTTLTHCLKGRRNHCSGYKWFYESVETNPDECKGVGVSLSHVQVRGNLQKVEEIVHSDRMENYQVSDKGFIQLATRSQQFKTINVRDVREGEIVGEDFVSGTLQFKSLPAKERANAPVVGYVAFFELITGFSKMLYMTKEELLEHAKQFSQTYRSDVANKTTRSVWSSNFDAMAKKTVLKLLLSKYAPMSIQLSDGIKYDQSIIDEAGRPHYVDLHQEDNADAVEVEVVEQANKTELPPEEGDAKVETKTPAPGAKPLGKQKEPDIFFSGKA